MESEIVQEEESIEKPEGTPLYHLYIDFSCIMFMVAFI